MWILGYMGAIPKIAYRHTSRRSCAYPSPMGPHINNPLNVQAEFGDYVENQHGSAEYFVVEHYVPETLADDLIRDELQEAHSFRRGIPSKKAEQLFIREVQRLSEYGQHHHSCKWLRTKQNPSTSIPLTLSICPNGICLYTWSEERRKLHEFYQWKCIQRLTYNHKHFCIFPHDIGGQPATRYKLKMDQKK